MDAGGLLREARQRVRLTQRALAARAGTSQAAVHRYERGGASPTIATFNRLIRACGLEIRTELVPAPASRTLVAAEEPEPYEANGSAENLDPIRYMLARTADQRLSDLGVSDELVRTARRVR